MLQLFPAGILPKRPDTPKHQHDGKSCDFFPITIWDNEGKIYQRESPCGDRKSLLVSYLD